MSLIRYEPASILGQLRNQLNRLSDPDLYQALWDDGGNVMTSRWTPSVDIKEEDDRFVFKADIPGVDPKEIEVTAENGMLTIKGERKLETEAEREGYTLYERSYGSFYRRFNLPDTADTDKISANCKHGVLELTIPKTEAVKPHKIEVKS